jgi:hypothetical protein
MKLLFVINNGFKQASMFSKKFFVLIVLLSVFFKPGAQVNLQTGSATFSIPMFNWQEDKSRLYSNVTLSYNSGNGLRVSSIASNVGQGWDLIAGGVITRMQNGEPDDQIAYQSGNIKIPGGYLSNPELVAKGCPIALTQYPIYKQEKQVYSEHNVVAQDRELDYFSFQFNGKVGMFVLDPQSTQGISIGESKLKITYQLADLTGQDIRTRITSFTIQDVDGLMYKFDRKGLSEVLKIAYCDGDLHYLLKQPKFKNNKIYHQSGFEVPGETIYPWVVDNWYLTQIKDPLTLREINIRYKNDLAMIDVMASEDLQFNDAQKNYVLVPHRRSIIKTPDIDSILFPDEHLVTFKYGNTRMDLNNATSLSPVNNARALSSVEIMYRGRYLSKYQLNTTYIIKNRYGTPITDFQKMYARLYLKSVQKIGPDLKEDSPPYIFDYYLNSKGPGFTAGSDDFVPARCSYLKDVWGFYNGSESRKFNNGQFSNYDPKSYLPDDLKGLCLIRDNRDNAALGPVLNAKPGFAKNGLLRQIIYPTGGTLNYEYEQNYGKINGTTTTVAAAGVHVSKTTSTDGGFSNGCDSPITTSYNYVLPDSSSSLWGLEQPWNELASDNHYKPEDWYYHWNPFTTALTGECSYRYRYPGILFQTQTVNLSWWIHAMNTIAPVLGVMNVLSTIYDIVTVIAGATPIALAIDIIISVGETVISCWGDGSKDQRLTTYLNLDLHSSNPLPLQFKRVEIVEGSGDRGRTVQHFTDDIDYPVWVPSNPLYSSKQRFAPWAYGLPKRTEVYGYDNELHQEFIVKTEDNEYSFGNDARSHWSGHDQIFNIKRPLNLISFKCAPQKSYSQNNNAWNDWANPTIYSNPNYYINDNTTGDLNVDKYDLYSGIAVLNKTTQKVYKKEDNNRFVETETEYYYNRDNYQVALVRTLFYEKESMLKTHVKEVQYVQNYISGVTNNIELNRLYDNNLINEPVSTAEYDNNDLLNAKVTVYTTLDNGDVKPGKILEQRLSIPGQGATFYFPNIGETNAGFKSIQEFIYDKDGNLTGLKDEGSRKVANIYGYRNKYVVASIINDDVVVNNIKGSIADGAYCSFEEDNEWGNWLPVGIFNKPAIGITGAKSLAMASGNSLNATLNSTKSYILSFWSGSGAVNLSINAAAPKVVGPINGFTYYEYELPAGNSTITLTGSATIDELRLYPKNARMRTVTYDPVLGQTSECDENNRITYYEYDNLGRLSMIKDENRNIVKVYEYNNVSAAKQNGCPATYYNNLIEEYFTKTNCNDPNYIGDNVLVSIPANTYSSTISQEDADRKAESHLMSIGQTTANNSNACIRIYRNEEKWKDFTTQPCSPGYIGGTVRYTVPAGRYSSRESQDDANDMALEEIDANGQYEANYMHPSCSLDNNPDWESPEGAPTQCQLVNNEMHLFRWITDVNPNSSSYNQSDWKDAGLSDQCPQPSTFNLYIKNTGNCDVYAVFRNSTTGGAFYITVPAGYDGYYKEDGINITPVSVGTYYIAASGSCSSPAAYVFGCGRYASGTSVSVDNVIMNSNCNIFISQ